MSVDRRSVWPYVDGEPGEFLYSRYAHPTGVEAEAKLGALEGGQALLFSSGSAATFALLLALLEPGKTVALAEGCYFGTGVMMREELGRWGLEMRRVRPDRAAAGRRRPDLAGGAVEPVPDDARLRGGRRPPGEGRRRLDRRDAGLPPPLRARRRLRAALGDEVPDRALGRARRRDRLPRRRPTTTGSGTFRQRTGPNCAADVAALVTRGLKTLARPRRAPDRDGDRRWPSGCARTREVEIVRYPGFGGLLSFDVDGDPLPVERAAAEDQERHVARRRRDDDGVTPPLGGRPRPGRPPPPVGRARGRRTRSGPTSSRRSPRLSESPRFGATDRRYRAGDAPRRRPPPRMALPARPRRRSEARSRRRRASSTRPRPSGLSSPTSMVWDAGERPALRHRAGRRPPGGQGRQAPRHRRRSHLNVDSNGERGLLGVELDPNFSSNHFLYLYYTVPGSPPHNRLSRFTATGDVASGRDRAGAPQPERPVERDEPQRRRAPLRQRRQALRRRRRERERLELADARTTCSGRSCG